MNLKWEEPPTRRSHGGRPYGTGKHAEIAARLRRRPGRWAVVGAFKSTSVSASMARSIRAGVNMSAYTPAGTFEAVARTVDGEHRVYARYVGGEGS
ncbi:hypothetical protein AB0E62_00260 [Streptomyces sp. NPDC038707]|uniref:hypothetical protein n=1 Tax=Streptomyces sp. NPDC038707 TaxID=3154329 RepID=UPI0033FC814D